MKAREAQFARFVKSRYMATILASVALLCILIGWQHGHPSLLTAHRGLAFESPNLWCDNNPALGLGLSVLCLLVTVGTMVYINIRYGILRSYSTTFAGLFMMMTAALPSLSAFFQDGALLAMIMMLSTALMCSVYNSPGDTKSIFLAFLMPSTGILFQYGFIVYVPVLLLGCAQMRVLNGRTLLAAVLGIVTPWWIWWAFGPSLELDVHWPRTVNIFDTMGSADTLRLLVTVGVTLFFSLVFALVNLLRIFNFNARSRSYNGLMLVMALITWIMLVVDYINMPFYVMLLNALTAFQIGHFFTLNYQRRGYLMILILALIYLGFYIWSMLYIPSAYMGIQP